MKKTTNFANHIKGHLTTWATTPAVGLRSDGVHGWVLDPSDILKNYFLEGWGQFIAGKGHQWAHALNSSQAFAVNLFGPAKASSVAAAELWRMLAKPGSTAHKIEVFFEYNGPGKSRLGRDALGERKQPTQIDVVLRGESDAGNVHFCLIEVKLSETKFGSCRGTNSRCDVLRDILADPERTCWMAENEGRRYWSFLHGEHHALTFDHIATEGCPWRGSLYQIMRNWAFGQALVAGGHANDFQLGVCVHAGNSAVLNLKEPVAGHRQAIEAFEALVPGKQILRIEPSRVVSLLEPLAPSGWGAYMRERYMLAAP